MDYANAKTNYNQQTAAQNYPEAAKDAQSASDAILSRLRNIRANLVEAGSSLNHAADKIVGSVPTPIAGASQGQIKNENPPASCFIDTLQQVLGDIEIAGSALHDHINRLHRSF